MEKTDEEWRKTLTPEQYQVLREHATERAGTSPLNVEKRDGVFYCAGCGTALFDSDTKYESGSGWPSFFKPLEHSVATTTDDSYGMSRTEVHCSKCGGHLGSRVSRRPASDRRALLHERYGASIRTQKTLTSPQVAAVIVLSNPTAMLVGYARAVRRESSFAS